MFPDAQMGRTGLLMWQNDQQADGSLLIGTPCGGYVAFGSDSRKDSRLRSGSLRLHNNGPRSHGVTGAPRPIFLHVMCVVNRTSIFPHGDLSPWPTMSPSIMCLVIELQAR